MDIANLIDLHAFANVGWSDLTKLLDVLWRCWESPPSLLLFSGGCPQFSSSSSMLSTLFPSFQVTEVGISPWFEWEGVSVSVAFILLPCSLPVTLWSWYWWTNIGLSTLFNHVCLWYFLWWQLKMYELTSCAACQPEPMTDCTQQFVGVRIREYTTWGGDSKLENIFNF